MKKDIKVMLEYHTKNLKRLEKTTKHYQSKEFRDMLIKEHRDAKNEAIEKIKNLEPIAKMEPIEEVDKHIKDLLSDSVGLIRKTKIIIKALEQYEKY